MLFLIILIPIVLIMGINWIIGVLASIIVGLCALVICAVAVLATALAFNDAKDEVQQ